MISYLAVVESEKIGIDVEISEYVVIRPGAVIGDNVIIHPFVVIEEEVTIGNGVEIFPGTYIGKKPKGTASIVRPIDFSPKLTVGNNCAIGPNATIFYDVEIGSDTLIGDGASLREQVRVGDSCVISRHVTVNYNTVIGNRTKIMDLTHITGNCRIGNDVFISALVSTVNDNVVVSRKYDYERCQGPVIEDKVTIGAGATLLPGILIGEGAMIGAGAVVTKDVAPYDVVMGMPARVKRNMLNES